MRDFGRTGGLGAGRLLSMLVLFMTTCAPALDRPIPDSVADFEQHFQGIPFDPIQMTASGRLHGWTAGDGLLAHLLMYEATKKIEYLEQFAEGANRLLDLRDSERGLPDSLGRLLPVWRTEDSYMGKQVVLRDSKGVPVLSLVTPNVYAWRDSDMGGPDTVEVRHLDQTRFALTLNLRYAGRSSSILWENLTMDRGQNGPDAFYAPLRFDPEHASFVPQSRALYGEDTTNTLRPWNRLNLFNLHAPDDWTSGMPSEGTFELVEGRFARSSNTGLATYPLAYFARIVRESEKLLREERWKSLADRYLDAARQALAVYDDDWRVNEKSEGWYVNPLSAPVYNAGREEPINRFILLGLPQLELWRVTGEELYRERIEKLATGLKNEMRYVEEIDAYVWPYWRQTGDVWSEIGGEQGGEDIYHAGVNVLFAYLSYRNGIVFDRADVRRLANTWMANVVREDGSFADLIDGRSAARLRSPAVQWRWAMLGAEDRRPYEVALRWYKHHAESWNHVPPEAELYDPDPIAKQNNLRHRMRLGWAALAWTASQISE